MLPLSAFQLLADFLNRIEKEGRWPTNLAIAKAAFLHKDDPVNAGPLDLRILLMVPSLNRRWASARLLAIDRWIKSWATSDMFAGLPGQGAQDAWYSTSILTEYLSCTGQQFSGGAADIYKCFDQIKRGIVYKRMKGAGIPEGILQGYINFQEALQVRNAVAGGLGGSVR